MDNPQLGAWSEVLFFAAIDGLYNAAAANAVASVGRAYADTAIRLALLLSPVVSVLNILVHASQLQLRGVLTQTQ